MMSFAISMLISLLLLINGSVSTLQPTTKYPTLQPTQSPTETESSYSTDCYVAFDSVSTSFNVCPLRRFSGFGQLSHYTVEDSRYADVDATDTYKYEFNIGGPMDVYPPACHLQNETADSMAWGWCDEPNDPSCSALKAMTDLVFAYQVKINSATDEADACWHLSNENGGPPTWSLLNENNPKDGVVLTYSNGDWDSTVCHANRKIHLEFECENELYDPNLSSLYIYEYKLCEYTIRIPHMFGCPIQCHTYNNEICGENGLCGFDFSNNQPKCFCYHSWTNYDCSVPESDPDDVSPGKDPDTASPYTNTFTVAKYDEQVDTLSVNVTYDLGEFELEDTSTDSYVLNDANINSDYVYYFGILQEINATIPTQHHSLNGVNCHKAEERCVLFDDDDNTCLEFDNVTDSLSYAYQVDPTNGMCYSLGTEYTWKLYDNIDDPARGVTITYTNGSYCDSENKNRQFSISLICPDDKESFYDPSTETNIDGLYVFEDDENKCGYTVEIETALACPYQCLTKYQDSGTELFSVCKQKGICASDPYAGFVRCLCDDGWQGSDCDQRDTPLPTKSPTMDPTRKPTPSPITRKPTGTPIVVTELVDSGKTTKSGEGGLVAGIVILIVVLMVAGVIVYYCYKKMKLEREALVTEIDDMKYGILSDKKNSKYEMNKGSVGFSTINVDKVDANSDDDEDDDGDNDQQAVANVNEESDSESVR